MFDFFLGKQAYIVQNVSILFHHNTVAPSAYINVYMYH